MTLFKPPPPIERLPEDKIAPVYEHWRLRHLYSTFIGYAVFYFVRKNIPVAMPLLTRDLNIGNADLGKFLTFHDIVYGFSKFLNGILGDRSNPRYFMFTGLILSAIANLCFGFSSSVLVLGVWWVLNGWFQGMGFPPCARLLAHWFSRAERGRKWSIWNTSHQVGGAGILVLSGWLGEKFGWRSIFIVPALIAIVTSFFLLNRLRDTPESLGLPPVEEYRGEEPVPTTQAAQSMEEPQPIGAHAAEPEESFASILVKKVFSNPYIWLICFANFFIYIIRFSFFNWAVSYLTKVKGVSLGDASWMTASFEIAGLVGSLLSGWLADKAMGGRRSPVCLIYMAGTALSIYAFWKNPVGNVWIDLATISLVGFFIYGPQFLVGVMVTDLASKEAAATAIGLTGFFGYISGIISGWGLGYVADNQGWDPIFQILLWCCLAAAIPFSFCLKKS